MRTKLIFATVAALVLMLTGTASAAPNNLAHLGISQLLDANQFLASILTDDQSCDVAEPAEPALPGAQRTRVGSCSVSCLLEFDSCLQECIPNDLACVSDCQDSVRLCRRDCRN